MSGASPSLSAPRFDLTSGVYSLTHADVMRWRQLGFGCNWTRVLGSDRTGSGGYGTPTTGVGGNAAGLPHLMQSVQFFSGTIKQRHSPQRYLGPNIPTMTQTLTSGSSTSGSSRICRGRRVPT